MEELVTDIQRFEAIVDQWDGPQKQTVLQLKDAIEDLHKEALTRLIRSVKHDAIDALKTAVQDEVVYGLLRYHGLVKSPSLRQRL
ncbi:MAG: hypothetical protein F6K35_39565, partial [Okeania sp. SIO2H7]|nr:hypothetical protein [Okeania sp. SIO2H7]